MPQQPHPKFPPPGAHIRGPLIWAHALLETDAACSRLLAMYKAAFWRARSDKSPRLRAMWTAYWALKKSVYATARDARNSGVLPYCWHGSKAFGAQPKAVAA